MIARPNDCGSWQRRVNYDYTKNSEIRNRLKKPTIRTLSVLSPSCREPLKLRVAAL